MITEKEARRRERIAYLRGVQALFFKKSVPWTVELSRDYHELVVGAKDIFPTPMVTKTRPRTVCMGALEFQVNKHGRLVCRSEESPNRVDRYWGPYSFDGVTPTMLRGIADLMENPTETVEEEDDS